MGLTPRADELIHDVKQCLRREVPELRDEPDIAQMTAENVAEHVVAIFFGVEHESSQGGSSRRPPTRSARVGWLSAGSRAQRCCAPSGSRRASSSTGCSKSYHGSPAMPNRSTRRHAS
ncbi:hypothetical protein ACFZDJ_50080 [Streptomyces sp. NPDC007896]|uniref:hypothetical protein n=1 Tax=Streptomyces sp. NPDC007896 TaxID=3364784 RepID=UPI0036E8FC0D